MIIKKYCKQCGKQTKLSREYDIGGLHFTQYTCGHSSGKKKPSAKDFTNFKSIDDKHPYPFQVDGATFALNSNGRFLIADEMGLGKTIQALMVAWSTGEKFLVVCKTSLKIQWARECYRWLDEALVQIIGGENEFILPGCRGYIISLDMLWRFKDIPKFIQSLGVDYIILDEVQHIKNSDSKRTKGVQIACQQVNMIGGLSGTPIKNNAGEFFPILNILHPEKFSEKTKFEMQFVDSYWTGYQLKRAGIKNWEKFEQLTKDFIIRRTRKEVLPDLPNITRQFLFTDLGGEELEESYKRVLKEFQDFMFTPNDLTGFQKSSHILAYLTRMRHITGVAKVPCVIDYLADFMQETDRKITIFLHHKDIAMLMCAKISAEIQQPLMLSAELSGEGRQEVIDKFKDSSSRILIASTLASGEGLNLQFCSDCIMMERQWNPANEEQAEARFTRIGQTADKVNAVYPIAVGTVDELFSEIVERKRAIVTNSLSGSQLKWEESSLVQELAEMLAAKGGQKWGI